MFHKIKTCGRNGCMEMWIPDRSEFSLAKGWASSSLGEGLGWFVGGSTEPILRIAQAMQLLALRFEVETVHYLLNLFFVWIYQNLKSLEVQTDVKMACTVKEGMKHLFFARSKRAVICWRRPVKIGSSCRAMARWRMRRVCDTCEASSTMCTRSELSQNFHPVGIRESFLDRKPVRFQPFWCWFLVSESELTFDAGVAASQSVYSKTFCTLTNTMCVMSACPQPYNYRELHR